MIEQLQSVAKNEDCVFCNSNEDLWNFMDGIYMICLKDREDRYQQALVEIHRTGLCKRLIFFRAERSADGFVAGCWDSHHRIAKYALSTNQSQVLVLEDDVEFDKDRDITSIINQIKVGISKLPSLKWTRLSLGHISWFKMHYAEGIDRASSVLTHAQIWSSRGLEWMANNPYDEISKALKIQVDGHISYKLGFSYSIKPMVAFQRNEGSDRNLVEPLLEKENMKNAEIWIPLLWLLGMLLAICFLILITRVYFKRNWGFCFLLILLLFCVPFFTVWILILCDVF